MEQVLVKETYIYFFCRFKIGKASEETSPQHIVKTLGEGKEVTTIAVFAGGRIRSPFQRQQKAGPSSLTLLL